MKKITSIPEGCALIDILSDSSFAREHIKGAKNISVYEVVFLEKMNAQYPDKNQAICVYGWSDKTEEAQRAYYLLTNAGYGNVSILEGGLEDWKAHGNATEKGEEPKVLDGSYILDPSTTRVEWSGRNIGNKHLGRVLANRGRFGFSGGDLKGGEVVADMHSISNMDLDEPFKSKLVNHLKSDDFFAVDKFPETTMKLVGVEKLEAVGEPNYRLKAALTIKGSTNEIDFDAFVREKEGNAIINAHFDIDRTRWNVKYGSERFFARVGIHIIADIISFDLILTAVKE